MAWHEITDESAFLAFLAFLAFSAFSSAKPIT